MPNFEEILPLILAILVAIILFFGFVTVVKKALKTSPKKINTEQNMKLKEQKRLMDDVRRRQKDLMKDQKQKIRDMQRR